MPQNICQLQRILSTLLGLIGILSMGSAAAALDLRNATVSRLDNGLTAIILEDRNFPVVSVQMLYRIGARDEISGKTGLAHFLEHMAFRDSENFPGTGLVSSIYAHGGEWHGYTWTDQTTYFATVPKERLDLLLRIEADRMSRLTLDQSNMEPERGAVLAEMHMYENDPSSMLIDAVMFTSFLAHPYRNNTIGWESDIENLTHDDVVSFYAQHYRPSNGVLVVVGDIDGDKALSRIGELFGEFEASDPTPLPVTVEPIQNGERRIALLGTSDSRRFMIGYRAPSANSPDFAAFLVLQELLGGGSGISFLQNDWGTPVREDSLLAGAADDLTTWYPPSAQDYIFVIGGSSTGQIDNSGIEDEIERRISTTRQHLVHPATLSAAISRVLDELVFDVETTEDAAHQLAFFEGLHALDKFLTLQQKLTAVTAADVQRVAQTWLKPERRTIAWHMPFEAEREYAAATSITPYSSNDVTGASSPVDSDPLPPPQLRELDGGIPVIIQPSDLSKSVQLQFIFQGSVETAIDNSPINAHSTIAYRVRPDQVANTIDDVRLAAKNSTVTASNDFSVSPDPETRLEQTFDKFLSVENPLPQGRAIPKLIVVSGDVSESAVLTWLDKAFGDFAFRQDPPLRAAKIDNGELNIELERPVPQAQLGYIVSVPGPKAPGYDAVRILQYILAHGYEGRLGNEAISKRGLAYYIDSRYRSDGTNGWVTLAIGVDPQKLSSLKALLLEELQRLKNEPPTIAEVEEAKTYFSGRAISAAQSNEELASALATQWLWHGDVQISESLQRRLTTVSHRDVIDAVPRFIDGLTIVVAE